MGCVCETKKFCKVCYSKTYYRLKRNDILQYQKQKYREKKAEQHKLIIQRGKFVLTFD